MSCTPPVPCSSPLQSDLAVYLEFGADHEPSEGATALLGMPARCFTVGASSSAAVDQPQDGETLGLGGRSMVGGPASFCPTLHRVEPEKAAVDEHEVDLGLRRAGHRR